MNRFVQSVARLMVPGLLLVLLVLLVLLHALPLRAETTQVHAKSPLFSWHLPSGILNEQGEALYEVLSRADEEGLNPADYRSRVDSGSVSDEVLTTAALNYISDLKVGRTPPRKLDPALHFSPPKIDIVGLLSSVYTSGNVKRALEQLSLNYPEYRLLKNKLAEFRHIEARGGWPKLPDGKSLQSGMAGPAVEILRRRLMAQDYLEHSQEVSPVFDDLLAEAVRNFQRHHGLDVDAKVGRKTREALNVPVGDRIRQIILNMERWRWLPDDLGRRHLRVNIAGFYLRVFEENRLVMEMPVIVGKPYRKTPIFSSVITDVTFHPYWHVPIKIAQSNVIPEIIKDSGYLNQQEFETLKPGLDGHLGIVEQPELLPWETFLNGSFPYILRQKPGSRNALGHVRFNIRNDFGIYMHGTPDQVLFMDVVRSRSSGCIRLAEPLKLTKYLLRGHPSWPDSRIDEVYFKFETIANPKPLIVPLIEPIPVHILYWTAWGEDDDHLYFSNDIYGRDKILASKLF